VRAFSCPSRSKARLFLWADGRAVRDVAHSAKTTIRVRLRYRPGITADMRVKHGTVYYRIESVIDVRSKRRELQLMCRRASWFSAPLCSEFAVSQ